MAHVIDGVSPFYSNESAQLAVATGIASESIHAVFTEEAFFARDDIVQEPFSWITACAAGAAPLGHVIWRSDEDPFSAGFCRAPALSEGPGCGSPPCTTPLTLV